jgi:hypothetical protein
MQMKRGEASTKLSATSSLGQGATSVRTLPLRALP